MIKPLLWVITFGTSDEWKPRPSISQCQNFPIVFSHWFFSCLHFCYCLYYQTLRTLIKQSHTSRASLMQSLIIVVIIIRTTILTKVMSDIFWTHIQYSIINSFFYNNATYNSSKLHETSHDFHPLNCLWWGPMIGLVNRLY